MTGSVHPPGLPGAEVQATRSRWPSRCHCPSMRNLTGASEAPTATSAPAFHPTLDASRKLPTGTVKPPMMPKCTGRLSCACAALARTGDRRRVESRADGHRHDGQARAAREGAQLSRDRLCSGTRSKLSMCSSMARRGQSTGSSSSRVRGSGSRWKRSRCSDGEVTARARAWFTSSTSSSCREAHRWRIRKKRGDAFAPPRFVRHSARLTDHSDGGGGGGGSATLTFAST